MREAVRSARRFAAAPPFAGYTTAQFTGVNATTDDQIDTFIRSTAATLFHPMGTASMSPKGASWGVVDPDLRVKGVVGLRIVDNSVVVGSISFFFSCPFFFGIKCLTDCPLYLSQLYPLRIPRLWLTSLRNERRI